MEIVGDKAVALRLRNPNKVTTTIPKSKMAPDGRVLVHWGVEETHMLRSMGFDVPSPISHRYDWPGQYKPFDHQRTTAEFLTLNKRAFCFNEQGCVDSETEYLSPTGWRRIADYDGGEVAQFNPETNCAEFVSPTKYVKLPCADMVRIKTKYGIDQLLSPEHRVLLRNGKSNTAKWETVAAEVLAARHYAYHEGLRAKRGGTRNGTDAIAFSSATIPTAFNYAGGKGISLSDAELRLMVAVIADGYFPNATPRCVVRLKKVRKKVRLRHLLGMAGVDYTEKPCLPDGFSRFSFHAPVRTKKFGEEFWGCTATQLAIVTDEVLFWDGCTTRGARFSTSEKESADFIQFAYAATGRTARISSRERGGSVEYTVQIRDTDRLYIRGSKPTITSASATDGFKYCFMVPSTYLVFRRNGCVFVSGNTGKTLSAIWAADFLMHHGVIRRALIISPLSIMDSAWRADLFKAAMHRTVDIAYGSANKRKQIISGEAEFVIINYDGVAIVRDEISSAGFDLIIVDEATHYKTATTKRWKALRSLLTEDTWLWMMTGTPAAQAPTDAYGLAKLVNPAQTPKFFGSFRDMVMTKRGPFRWEPKPSAVETVHRLLQPAIRFTKEECLDLPDMLYTSRNVDMTKQQKLYYDKLRKELLLEVAGSEVTAMNAAVKMNKLLQIACGAVYTDDSDTLLFDISERYKVLREVIDESSHKVLVFVPYRNAIERLSEELAKDNIATEVISGAVKPHDRTDIFRRFQTTDKPRVLLIQPQAAAHGVTLTAANTVVWWSPTASLETYAQANARVHRAGQTNKCTVVHLEGAPVERKLYTMLSKRIDVHSQLVGLYKDLLD